MYRRNNLPARTDIGLFYASSDTTEDCTLDLSSLFVIIDAVRCHPHAVGERLCQAVADLTAQQACLSFHLSSAPCSEPYETGSMRFPVQYEDYIYGTLCIALEKKTNHPSLPIPVAEQLAKTCGIIINTIEKEIFVRFQARHSGSSCIEPLTVREREVLMHMGQGLNQREIARLLHISPATVATYRQHIYAKWGVNRSLSAVLAGHEAGLFFYLTAM